MNIANIPLWIGTKPNLANQMKYSISSDLLVHFYALLTRMVIHQFPLKACTIRYGSLKFLKILASRQWTIVILTMTTSWWLPLITLADQLILTDRMYLYNYNCILKLNEQDTNHSFDWAEAGWNLGGETIWGLDALLISNHNRCWSKRTYIIRWIWKKK